MINIYIPGPRQVPLIKNTDWRYPSFLAALSRYRQDIQTHRTRDFVFDLHVHAIFAVDLLRRRAHLPIPYRYGYRHSQYYKLPRNDRAAMRADVILAYERYPSNAQLPVIWLTGPTDIEKLRRRGRTEGQIAEEIEFKREATRRAGAVILTNEYAKRMFEDVIRPEKTPLVIPFLIPATPVTLEECALKWRSPKVLRLVFVGRAAVRKGLGAVIESFRQLQTRFPGKFELLAVSSMADGKLDVPSIRGLTYKRELTREETLEAMRQAHVMIVPAVHESYGWVYIEAMAQGAIPVAHDSPVQRELLQNGEAGLLVDQTPDSITEALSRLVEMPIHARELAGRARLTWEHRFSPFAVSRQFAELAEHLCTRPPFVTSSSFAQSVA